MNKKYRNNLNKVLKIFENPFVIGLTTIYGYSMGYFNQLGYLQYFGLGPNLIETNIPEIIWSLSFVFMLCFSLLSFIRLESEKGWWNIIWGIVLLVPYLGYWFASGFSLSIWIFLVTSFFAWVCFMLSIVQFNRLKVKSINDLIEQLLKKFRIRLIGAVVFIFITPLFITYLIGFLYAKWLPSFSTICIDGRMLVVITYFGDELIAAPLDKTYKFIYNDYYFYKTDDLNKQKSPLQLKDIGPLYFNQSNSVAIKPRECKVNNK